MSESFQRLKGFADLYGSQAAQYALMEKCAREVFFRYGFSELRTPILEQTSLFRRSIGGETDVVQKEMFTFSDAHGREMTLRPEATAGVMRACAVNGLARQGAISRFFTFGPMFRHERPQKGRMRQFHQINCECLGSDSPLLDAEVILMLLNFLETLQISGLRLKINSLGCPQCRKNYLATLAQWLKETGPDTLCADCQRRSEANPLRVLDCKEEACRKLLENAPLLPDYLCEACRVHFQKVFALLRENGASPELEPRLVRGLDYYCRTTFEVVSDNIGAQTAVAGGGRYDGLLGNIGGPDLPGIGFACGMERLALLMPPAGEAPLDFFFGSSGVDDKDREKVFHCVEKLRRAGFSGEMNYADGSIKSIMRQAGRSGAKFCFLFGADEARLNVVTLKNMQSGGQWRLDLNQVVEALAHELSKSE